LRALVRVCVLSSHRRRRPAASCNVSGQARPAPRFLPSFLQAIPLGFSAAVSSPPRTCTTSKTTRIVLLVGSPVLTSPQRYRGWPVRPYLVKPPPPNSRRLSLPVSPLAATFRPCVLTCYTSAVRPCKPYISISALPPCPIRCPTRNLSPAQPHRRPHRGSYAP
jgi:hypothetical protein